MAKTFFDNDIASKYYESLELEIQETEDDVFPISYMVAVAETEGVLLSAYESMLFDESDEEEVTTEGANLEYRAKFKELKKLTNLAMKQYKIAMKNNDFKAARKYADEIIENGNRIVKEIKDIDGDAFSVIVGNIISTIQWYIKIILIGCAVGFSIGTIVGAIGVYKKAQILASIGGTLAAGGISAIILAIKGEEKKLELIAQEFNGMSNAKNGHEAISSQNKLRNGLIERAEKIVKHAEVLKKVIDDKEAKYKEKMAKEKEDKKNDIKESADQLFKNVKAEIYENCRLGNITLEEREDQIAEVRDIIYAKQIIAEESKDIDDFSTKEEAFSTIKKAIYERCASGEFNEEVRETLISNAYDQIFYNEMDANAGAAGAAGGATQNQAQVQKANTEANKEIQKAADNAKKELEKNSTTQNVGEDYEKGMDNPAVGDPPMKESDDIESIVNDWNDLYNESDNGDKKEIIK